MACSVICQYTCTICNENICVVGMSTFVISVHLEYSKSPLLVILKYTLIVVLQGSVCYRILTGVPPVSLTSYR
jgi:hypothetical protein